MKSFGKIAVLIAGAAMTMGNQKCQQKAAAPPPRILKKIVDMGAIRSSPVVFPGGGSFDFRFVANQQIYGVLQESKEFTFKYAPPIATAPVNEVTNANGDTNMFNLTSADGAMMKSSARQAGLDNYQVQYAQTAWCMVNLPQAKITGSVNSFELIGGGGITVGFTPAGAFPTNGLSSTGIDVQFSQLDLSMLAIHPLTSTVMAASNVNAKQTKTSVKFTLNFGAFSAGPSAYYQTPLAAVTKKALTNAVAGLNDQLKSEEWFSRVMANHDTHLVVVGGTDVGIEVGDQFLIYNEEYYWEGEPCNSRYLGGGSAVNAAVAKIEIDYVGDEISRGRIVEQNDFNAVVGAKVKLSKFHDPTYAQPIAGVQSTGQSIAQSPAQSSAQVNTK